MPNFVSNYAARGAAAFRNILPSAAAAGTAPWVARAATPRWPAQGMSDEEDDAPIIMPNGVDFDDDDLNDDDLPEEEQLDEVQASGRDSRAARSA